MIGSPVWAEEAVSDLDALAPVGLPVTLAAGVKVLDGGTLILGGTPLRVIVLSSRGAGVVSGWSPEGIVGPSSGSRQLARRLLDAGILVPRPEPAAVSTELSFVVPVRNRPQELARCLDSIGRTAPESPVIVVDDGSAQPVQVDAARHPRVRIIRHPSARGPAAARNTGLAACASEFIGFVDSDVVLPSDAVAGLLAHLDDRSLGVVAPRIRALREGGWVGGYEARHSALDMGRVGGLVAPGRRLSYVPSAVLVGRRDACMVGFDEDLGVGEDVDFVWRMHAAGWGVRYVPEIEVWHEHPARFSQFVRRRYAYAGSVGSLARRHPQNLPAARIPPLAALAWCLGAGGCKRWAAAAAVAAGVQAGSRISAVDRRSPQLHAQLMARSVSQTAVGLAWAVRRPWLPLLLAFAPGKPRIIRVLAASFAIRLAQDMALARGLRAAAADVPLRLVDELVGAAGTWRGCLGARTLRPLQPAFRPLAR